MPTFHYKAIDASGKNVEGDREAKDKFEAAHALRADGLSPLTITEPDGSAGWNINLNRITLPSFLKRIKTEEIMNFTRNTGVMIGAGLSLSKALEIMARQTKNEKFKATILSMVSTVRQGKSFADALTEHPDIFPKFFQEMVRAGEKSGKMEESLKLIGIQLKRDYALKRKIKSAMIYPMVILIAMVAIGILMLIYVVPTLIATFKDLDVELPASTRFIIFVSETLLKSGLIFLGALAVLGFALWKWLKSRSGKIAVDYVLAYLPVIRGINQKFNSARTCRTLSSLISSGVEILEALSITENVIQNHFYKEILEDAKSKIQRGETIAKSFLGGSSEKFYPPLVGEMIAVGEETGELSGMLLRLALFYENEVAVATKDLSTIVEPVLMILIGIVVGFFSVSMISPMYNLVDAF